MYCTGCLNIQTTDNIIAEKEALAWNMPDAYNRNILRVEAFNVKGQRIAVHWITKIDFIFYQLLHTNSITVKNILIQVIRSLYFNASDVFFSWSSMGFMLIYSRILITLLCSNVKFSHFKQNKSSPNHLLLNTWLLHIAEVLISVIFKIVQNIYGNSLIVNHLILNAVMK